MPFSEWKEHSIEAVKDALQYAYLESEGEPVTISKIAEAAGKYGIEAPGLAEFEGTGRSGYSVFDYGYRVHRFLKILVNRGQIESTQKGKQLYFEPIP